MSLDDFSRSVCLLVNRPIEVLVDVADFEDAAVATNATAAITTCARSRRVATRRGLWADPEPVPPWD